MKKSVKYLAVLLSTLLLIQQVLAEGGELVKAGIENTKEVIGNLSDTFDAYGDKLKNADLNEKISGGINAVIDKLTSGMACDVITSGEALHYDKDFSLNDDDYPEYINNLLYCDKAYSALSDVEKTFLMQYVGVREDSMSACEQWGYSILESVPVALIMQKMEISIDDAHNLTAYYGSESKAMDIADLYNMLSFRYGFLDDSELKDELVKLVTDGISPYSLPDIYAVSGYMNIKPSEAVNILNIDNLESVNTFKALDASVEDKTYCEMTYDAVKYVEEQEISLNQSALDGVENADVIYAITSVRENALLPDNNEAVMYSSITDSQSGVLSMDSLFKTGPIDYNACVNDTVDLSSGILRYNEELFSIKGANGFDFDLALRYSSNRMYASDTDYRFNKLNNWSFSFPYLSNAHGENLNEDYIPTYVTTTSGDTYEVIDNGRADEYKLKKCYNGDIRMGLDPNHAGGENSAYYLKYSDGKIQYFDNKGRWLSSINRYGNRIYISSDDGGTNSSTIKIKDSLNNEIVFTYNVYSTSLKTQIIKLPDNSEIKLEYSKENLGEATKWILSSKTVGSETTSYKYQLVKGGGNKNNYGTVKAGNNGKNTLLAEVTYPSGLKRKYEYTWKRVFDIIMESSSQTSDRAVFESYTYGDGTTTLKVVSDDYAQAVVAKKYYVVDNVNKAVETYVYDDSAGYGGHYSYGNVIKILRNDPNVHINHSTEYEAYTEVNNGLSTANYTFDIDGRNIFEVVTGAGVTKTTSRTYSSDPTDINPGRVMTVVNNNTQLKEYYLYTGTGKLSSLTVQNGNEVLSQINNEYSSDYDILTKTTVKKNDGETVVRENKLLEGSVAALNKKVVSSETTKVGDKICARTDYTYYTDTNNNLFGRLKTAASYKELNSVGGVNRDKYIKQEYTYAGYADASELKTTDKATDTERIYTNKFTYDKIGRPLTVVNALGICTEYEYDAHGNVVLKKSYKNSGKTAYNYEKCVIDYVNNRQTVTVGNNSSEESKLCYHYDSAGNLLSVADLLQSPTVTLQNNTYDNYMRLSTHTDNNNKGITTYTYNWESMPLSIVTKEGNTVLSEKKYAYEYNTQGLKTTKTVVGDDTSKSIVSSVQQDLIGRTIYEDNSGRTDKMFTRYSYDNMNNVTKKEIGSGSAVKLTYQYDYDYAGNVLKETLQGRQNAAYTYDMLGNMLTSADAKGNVTQYEYSGDGLLLKKLTPIDSSTKGEAVYTYDNAGNLIKERVKSRANAYNEVTYTYDGCNNLIRTRQSNNITDYTYDSRGNVLTMTVGDEDDSGFARTTTYHYDSMGRCTSLTDPMGYIERYTYDTNGDMTKKTDKNGTVISYTYDGMHRVTSTSAAKNGKNQTIINTYGRTGGLISESDGTSSKTYKYNDLGLIEEAATKVSDKTYTIKKTYDYMGNVSSVNYGYFGVKYGYDVQGRLISVNNWNLSTGAVTKLEEYQYDNNNNVVKKVAHTGLPDVEYTYNSANLLSTLKQGDIVSYKYTYTPNGNISDIDDYVNNLHTRYSYSGRNQLVSEISRNTETNSITNNISYEYDAAGNRIYINCTGYESEYIYDANNRLITEKRDNKRTEDDEIISYQYDKNGNRIGISGAATTYSAYPTAATTYTYDAFNRLTQISDGSNVYKYDYYVNGLRMSKDVNGTKTYFQWDGDQLWGLSANTRNSLTHYYYRGLNGNIKDNYGAAYIYNGHGDVVKVANSSGTVTKNYDYDAFGVISSTSSTDSNPWRYCGEYYDTETGYIYLRARYYDPGIGGFITEDPVRDGINWYSYCEGNPANMFDRFGLSPYFNGDNWTEEDKKKFVNDLQQLTDFEIYIVGDFVEYKQIDNLENYNVKHPKGNELIQTVFDSEDIPILKSYRMYYHPENNSIEYNPNENSVVWVEENDYTEDLDGRLIKRGMWGENPSYIALGHELIHYYGRILGYTEWDPYKGVYNYGYYIGMQYHYDPGNLESAEEYTVIGLDKYYYLRVTENSLRREVGLNKRISHKGKDL